jgi:hypothetical protein
MAEKYEGLFSCPATDENFASAIHSLSVDELEAFKGELITRDLDEHCHKGRISAVAREIRQRGSGSTEMVAVVKLKEELQEADRLYLDGKPYDLDRIDNEVSFFQAKAGESLLEVGKRFILVKLHEDHGKFLAFLEKHGMGARSAQYAMLAAKRFLNTKTFSHLETSKMIALSVLDDDSIQALEDGGNAAGVTVDDIEKMSVRELKETLRKEREKRKNEKKTREDAIAKKEEKINELEQQLRYQEPPTKEQRARAAVQRFRDPIIDNILEATERMGRAIAAIDEAQKVPDVPYEALEELLEPWKESFNTFCDTAEDLTSAFNNIHVDKGRG